MERSGRNGGRVRSRLWCAVGARVWGGWGGGAPGAPGRDPAALFRGGLFGEGVCIAGNVSEGPKISQKGIAHIYTFGPPPPELNQAAGCPHPPTQTRREHEMKIQCNTNI